MTLEALTATRPWLLAGWTMLHFLWVGGLIGLLTALARWATRMARPELRYGVALAGLTALIIAPVGIGALLISDPYLQSSQQQAILSTSPQTFAQALTDTADRQSLESVRSLDYPEIKQDVPISPSASVGETFFTRRFMTLAARGLPGLWLAGAPITFILLTTGLIGTERLRRQCRVLVEGEIPQHCRRLATALGVIRPVSIGVSDRIVTPLLLGVLRPLILLPTSAMTGWSTEQIEMALLHELAHVRRLDNLVNLAQRTVEALLFFHPAVWWVSSWVRIEREHCCDQTVVAHTGRPRPYAELLAALAAPGAPRRQAAVAMAEAPIVDRIRRILNLEDQPMGFSRGLIILVAALFMAPAALMTVQAGSQAQAKDQPPAPAPEEPNQTPLAKLEPLVRRAIHGAEMFQDLQGRAVDLSQIARAQARAGDRDGAKKTFAQAVALAETVSLDDARHHPHVLLWVALGQEKAGFRDEAIASLRTLLRITEAPVKKENDKSYVFISLLEAQSRLGDTEGIRETLQSARKFHTSTTDESIQRSAPFSLIGLQAESGDLTGAFRMIHDSNLFQGKDAENRRRSALFSIVSRIKAGDDQAARPILEEAIQAANSIKDEFPWRGVIKRNQDLSSIARAEARLGWFAEATKRAHEVDAENLPGHLAASAQVEFIDTEKFKKAGLFNSIAEEQAKRGDRAGVRQSAETVARIVAAISTRSLTFAPMESASISLAKVGDFAGAILLANAMRPEWRAEQYLAVATIQQQSGDEAGAKANLNIALTHLNTLLKWESEDEASAKANLNIALAHLKALAKSKKPDQLDSPPVGTKKRNILLASKSRICAAQGDLKGAIDSARQINHSSDEIVALKAVARIRALQNDLNGAMEAIKVINSAKMEAEALQTVLESLPDRPARDA